ncbi:MAG: hypothetical protein WDN76_05250 [Alphaproteobacteria bacterium]
MALRNHKRHGKLHRRQPRSRRTHARAIDLYAHAYGREVALIGRRQEALQRHTRFVLAERLDQSGDARLRCCVGLGFEIDRVGARERLIDVRRAPFEIGREQVDGAEQRDVAIGVLQSPIGRPMRPGAAGQHKQQDRGNQTGETFHAAPRAFVPSPCKIAPPGRLG